MRFDRIAEFQIDDLSLDEENYRFTKAEDQQACINKIYNSNPPYFRGLMQSISEDDLGEPLLVFQKGDHNIVADGNRRLSAMKVLHSGKYAPNDSLRDFARQLREGTKVDFNKIQAQVSDNQSLIARTVYERHSGGKNGTSRIPWNAYAAARFGFDESLGESKEWHIMALLTKTEEDNPSIIPFVDSNDFSYEVFRRVIRAAINKGRISQNIFSERGERIKKTARADLVTDAVSKTHKFLLAMVEKQITLSRKDGENYADKETVDRFIEEFSLSPDNKELEDAKPSSADGETTDTPTSENSGNSDQTETDVNDDDGENGTDETQQNSSSGADTSSPTSTSSVVEYGVGESKEVHSKLQKLKSKKLTGLYNSLCKVSLNQHPALMYVGAWSFFEVLAKLAGNSSQEFPAFYRNKFQSFNIEKQTGKDCGQALDEISRYGNATKHSKNATPLSAIQLKNSFEVLEPLIVAAVEEATKLKKQK